MKHRLPKGNELSISSILIRIMNIHCKYYDSTAHQCRTVQRRKTYEKENLFQSFTPQALTLPWRESILLSSFGILHRKWKTFVVQFRPWWIIRFVWEIVFETNFFGKDTARSYKVQRYLFFRRNGFPVSDIYWRKVSISNSRECLVFHRAHI